MVRRGKEYSYYVCGARWKRPPRSERCRSSSLGVEVVEGAIYGMVVDLLNGPVGFKAELQRQRGISKDSEASYSSRTGGS